jgi:hypothetical protein
MMSLRNVSPAACSRSTSAAMSSTTKWMRFQPPGCGGAAVGHRPPGRALGAAEQQPQVARSDVLDLIDDLLMEAASEFAKTVGDAER